MIAIKYGLLVLLGLSSGFAVAGGVFAFITMLGIVPRLADRTGTVRCIVWYERMIVLGGTVGNVWFVFSLSAPGGGLLLAVYGLCAGIYVGCLAMALAEMLRLLPIFVNRLQICEGFPLLVLAIALGKATGTLFQFIIL